MFYHASAATVTTLADSGAGSLRAAIALGGTVTFNLTGTITLTSGEITISLPVTIVGSGADQLTIQRSTAPGIPEFRLFTVRAATTIAGVTLSNGLIGNANGYDDGGCILQQADLTLVNCAITDHHSVGGWTRGTAIYNDRRRLVAVNCLFARNIGAGFDAEGSAIYNTGSLALTNCTFSGNSAGYTAAIQHDGLASGTAVIESCTIVNNSGRFTGGIVNGGAVPTFAGHLQLRNSIVAGNVSLDSPSAPRPEDVENRGIMTSGGYNLIGYGFGNITLDLSDQVGIAAGDVRLGPLADNGGPTFTHALLLGSLAIDSGPPTGFPPTDQRGFPRAFGLRADIGAFESTVVAPLGVGCPTPLTIDGTSASGAPATLTVTVMEAAGNPVEVVWTVNGVPQQTNSVPVGGGPTVVNVSYSAIFPLGLNDVVVYVSDGIIETQSCTTAVNVRDVFSPGTVHVNSLADSGFATLRNAIDIAPTNGTIVFSVNGTINLTRGELLVNKPLNIVGPGADRLTIQRSEEPGTPEFRVVDIWSGPVSISGVTIRNGYLSGVNEDDGAGIINWADLILRDCVIRDNRVGGSAARGAGLQNFWRGTVRANNCTFANNHCLDEGSEGGGFYNYWYIALTNCTLSGNSAGDSGGGFHNDALSSNVVLHSCTIVSNSAPQGSGIYNNGFSIGSGVIDIKNSIIAANLISSDYGYEIYNSGSIRSHGHNLFGTAYGITPDASDRVGLTADQLRVGPLQNNGGPTTTHALLAGSVAIDAGDDSDCLPTDQRGVTRSHYLHCDAGAFETDELPPTLQCPAATTACGSTGPETLTLSATVQDPDADEMVVVWMVNGVPYQTNTVGAGSASLDGTILSFTATYPIGSYAVMVAAWDGKSEPVNCTTTVTVGDTTPPRIKCPDDISVATDPGQCSAIVNYLISVADNCLRAKIACSPAKGSAFPKGTTVVHCTATDAAGNTADCSFKVSVADREAPVIGSVTATPAILSPANHQMVNVSVAVSAGDNCGAVRSRIIGVASSDPVSGTSPADRSPDWLTTGPLSLQLRAELSNPARTRTYTIAVESRDDAGNITTRTINVRVPARH